MSNFIAISKLGVQAAQSGDLATAEKYFRQAADMKGEPPEAIFNLCRLLNMQGRHKDVVQSFTKRIKSQDYVNIHPQLLLIASQSAQSCRNHSLAIEILSSLHYKYPENIETSVMLSTLEIEAGRLSAAMNIINITIKQSGRSPSLLTNLAICESEMGNLQTADTIHKEIISKNPEKFLAYFNYGKYLATVGETSLAKQSFKKCLEIVPNAPEALEAINQIEPQDTSIAKFYAKIELGDYHGAAVILKEHSNTISTSDYLSCISYLNEKYRSWFGESRQFSPKQLVHKHNLNEDTSIDLNSLYTYVKNSESLIKDRPGKPTINGYQTYEVLKGSTNQTVKILCEKIISLATDYYDTLELPYKMGNGNNRYEISGWGVALNGGGHQKLHTHPEAKISGVLYLKTSKETESMETDKGNILFPTVESLSIAPYTGLMIIFPSYLPHSTVPTTEENERVCIAFNVNF